MEYISAFALPVALLIAMFFGYRQFFSEKIVVGDPITFDFSRFKPGVIVADSYEYAAKSTFLKLGQVAFIDLHRWSPGNAEEAEAAHRILEQLNDLCLKATGSNVILVNYLPYDYCYTPQAKQFSLDLMACYRLEQ